MHVDRSRFLFLAGAIAAGCGGPKPATGPVSSASTTGTPSSAVPVANDGPGLPPGERPIKVAHPPSGEGYYPDYEGGYAPPHGEGYGGYEDAQTPTLAKQGIHWWTWKCAGDDGTGAPRKCGVAVPKSCAPFPFVEKSCRGANTYFKPKIAERAVSCIHALSEAGVCAAMSYQCKEQALKSACPDTSVDVDCKKILGKCAKVSMASCRGYLSGLNGEGRVKVVDCMSNAGACKGGIYSCIEGLND